MDPSPADFGALPPGPLVEPNPSTAKTMGSLNIVFGSILLLCGGCCVLQIAQLSQAGPSLEAAQQQMKDRFEAAKQQQIQQFKNQEQAASNAQEKAALAAQRQALEKQPMPNIDLKKLGLDDPTLIGFFLAESITGALFNLALLVSGIGLVSLKEWGRVTALAVAGLKAVRLVALYGFFVVAIVPVLSQRMADVFEDMVKNMPQQGPGAPNAQQMQQQLREVATGLGTMMTVYAVGMVLLGLIYPIVLLLVLTRPGVKAACAQPVLPEDF